MKSRLWVVEFKDNHMKEFEPLCWTASCSRQDAREQLLLEKSQGIDNIKYRIRCYVLDSVK